MNIHIIWAQDSSGGIGSKNKLPWHVSEDLKNFKALTMHSPIVMGRKTWDSLPIKPLPGRINYVLSSAAIDGTESFTSHEKCMDFLSKKHANEDVFVIGGASIYSLFYPYASELHLTSISIESDNIDTFFPISANQIHKQFKTIEKKWLCDDATYVRMVRLDRI